MKAWVGTDVLDSFWKLDKWENAANLTPRRDSAMHGLGDECFCNPVILRPTCGGCGGRHFAIICHNPRMAIPTAGRDNCRDKLVQLTMQR